jgi:hypothetical protein
MIFGIFILVSLAVLVRLSWFSNFVDFFFFDIFLVIDVDCIIFDVIFVTFCE